MKLILLLILLLPLAGFLALGMGLRKIPKRIASWIGPGTVLISFLLSSFLLLPSTGLPLSGEVDLFDWIVIGPLNIPFSFLIDPLSILMMLIVTGVGFIIHVYSVGYMAEDPGFNRFFSYMNLFIFFMLLLVMGASYPVMFIGWEGVGLCSYLLIGFWFRTPEFNDAAKKAFIMNRIGDLGFLLGMFLLFTTFGTLNYLEVFREAKTMIPGNITLTVITLLLFAGATGKSAQIPLYTWLPDAMAGPTPVSALIHAATMVAAGVYMVARSGILYALSPLTMTVMAAIGLATALFAAFIAIFQNDIKKILAYSTISQLGYMFLGLAVGSFTGAMFHLTTHAFFKALLFLAAGSVIHALGGEQDIRNMGGLKNAIPKTAVAFLVGVLTITGIPPFAGFFSKDEILASAFSQNAWLWAIGLIGALMTAFYMFRLYFMVFSKEFREKENIWSHIHESPAVMTIPLFILALLSLAGGVINIPGIMRGASHLEHFLAPVFSDANAIIQKRPPVAGTDWILMGVTLFGVLIMIWLARQAFVVRERPWEAGWLGKLAENKFYVDELYDRVFVRPVLGLSTIFHRFVELKFIDRIVNGIGQGILWMGNTVRYLQTGHVGFYLFMMVFGIIAILLLNLLIF